MIHLSPVCSTPTFSRAILSGPRSVEQNYGITLATQKLSTWTVGPEDALVVLALDPT